MYSIRDKVSDLALFGYPGIFIVSVLANSTVILPAPTLAIVFAMGGLNLFNPLFVGIVSGVGSGIGEITGYLAGYSGQVVVESTNTYSKIVPFIEKYEALTIFTLAVIPNPLFNLAGIAAGMLKVPFLNFLFWSILGKTIKMMMFSYAGAYSINWLLKLLQ